MSTSNPKTPEQKRILRAKLIEGISPVLKKYNISEESFIPKAIFEENNVKYIRLYAGDVNKARDLYIELVTTNYEPILTPENKRRILMWTYNPFYKEEYRHHVEKNIESFLIPIDELFVVGTDEGEKTKLKISTKDVQIDTGVKKQSLNKDSPIKDLSIRDIFAIYHEKPVSFKPWLNDLIRELKNE